MPPPSKCRAWRVSSAWLAPRPRRNRLGFGAIWLGGGGGSSVRHAEKRSSRLPSLTSRRVRSAPPDRPDVGADRRYGDAAPRRVHPVRRHGVHQHRMTGNHVGLLRRRSRKGPAGRTRTEDGGAWMTPVVQKAPYGLLRMLVGGDVRTLGSWSTPGRPRRSHPARPGRPPRPGSTRVGQVVSARLQQHCGFVDIGPDRATIEWTGSFEPVPVWPALLVSISQPSRTPPLRRVRVWPGRRPGRHC